MADGTGQNVPQGVDNGVPKVAMGDPEGGGAVAPVRDAASSALPEAHADHHGDGVPPLPEPPQVVGGGEVEAGAAEAAAAARASARAGAGLPPDDFDIICSDERDLLGNFLVRDLIFHHGTRNDNDNEGDEGSGSGGGNNRKKKKKSVEDVSRRIVSAVREGLAFAVAGDERYGGGRFLRRVEVEGGGGGPPSGPGPAAYRELSEEEARAYIAGVFRDAFPQIEASSVSTAAATTTALGDAVKAKEGLGGSSAEKGGAGGGGGGVPTVANENDVLLLNGSIPYPETDGRVYASHPGNRRFLEFLNAASSGLESSGLDSSPGAATARAQLFISAVDAVRGPANQGGGRFLAQKRPGGQWADLDDELAVWEIVTVLLWRKFLERERQKLLSPPPPPPPPLPLPHPAAHGAGVEPAAVQPPPAAVVAKPAAPAAPAPAVPPHAHAHAHAHAQALTPTSPPSSLGKPIRGRESQQYSRWPTDYQVVPPSNVPVARPTDHDVLFGRGGLTNHHPGNKRFRDVIAVHRADYVAAIKIEKPNVARKIVRAIRCGNPAGRFLKKNNKDGLWYDVGDRHAAEKASQALREKSQAEKYEKIALKKQAEAAIQHSKETKVPFGMPPLADGGVGVGVAAVPAAVTAVGPSQPPHMVVPYPPPPGHPMYGMAVAPGQSMPPLAGAEDTDDKGGGTKRKAPGTEPGLLGPPDNGKKLKASAGVGVGMGMGVGEGPSSGEVYTPIDEYGNIVVTDHDILCGRGGLTNHHLGNKRFRDIVSLHRPDYIRAPKIEKPSVARMIVSAIRNGNPPGRFLKKDKNTGKWFDIGDKRAAEKASQALREKTPEERLKIAARNDRPMPTRQYFSPANPAAAAEAAAPTRNELPAGEAESPGVKPLVEPAAFKEDPDETMALPVPPTPETPARGGENEVMAEV